MTWQEKSASWGQSPKRAVAEEPLRRPSWQRGLVAGLAVILGGGLAAWWLFSGRAAEPEPTREKSRTADSPAPTAAGAHRKKFKPTATPRKTAKIVVPEIAKADVILDPLRKVGKEANLPKLEFEHAADELIAGVMTARPGERFIFVPDDEEFDQLFEESLKTDIKISADDPPELAAKKRALVDAKLAILEYMQAGEKPGAVVREAIEEMNKLADYREKLENEIASMSESATRGEVREFLAEANKLLEEYGVDPITFDFSEMPEDETEEGSQTETSPSSEGTQK